MIRGENIENISSDIPQMFHFSSFPFPSLLFCSALLCSAPFCYLLFSSLVARSSFGSSRSPEMAKTAILRNLPSPTSQQPPTGTLFSTWRFRFATWQGPYCPRGLTPPRGAGPSIQPAAGVSPRCVFVVCAIRFATSFVAAHYPAAQRRRCPPRTAAHCCERPASYRTPGI